MESIRESKAISACATQEAKTIHSTTIKEAKATCACSIQEAENLCSRTVRDMEAQGASQADSLQQLCAKSIQCLEKQSIKEEGKGQLDFLSACQTTLQVSPVELHGTLVASYHVLLGHALMVHPLAFHKELPPWSKLSAPMASSSLVPEHSPRPKWQHPSPNPVDVSPLGRTTYKATS